jgi:hypothetical protein
VERGSTYLGAERQTNHVVVVVSTILVVELLAGRHFQGQMVGAVLLVSVPLAEQDHGRG